MVSLVYGELSTVLLSHFFLTVPPCNDMKSNNYTLNKYEEFAYHSQHTLYTRVEDTL